MIELDKIYHDDCLIGMKEIPNNFIDCIICDLPYGTTQNTWDSIIPLDELWEQYKRICKPNAAIILFSQQPFTAKLIMSNIDMFRYEWIWEKDNATGFLNAKRMPLKIHENILLFYEKLPTYNPIMRQGFKPYFSKRKKPQSSNYNWYKAVSSGSEDGSRYPIDIIQFNKDNDTFHPTQKPVKLVEYLIYTYTNEGDIVLDNCMGSGTTAVAAFNTNRHFIGFEKDEKYFKLAEKRIKENQQQLKLF
jgi:site-specific DNA-methyltransferase (adenine-specific)